MQKLLFTILTAALLLSACAPAAAPTAAPSLPPTQAPASAPATQPAKSPAYPAAGQADAQASSSAAYPAAGQAGEKPASGAAYPAAGQAAQPAPAQSAKVTYKIVPGDSKVQYEVGETFINQNNRINLAVGVTTTISGEIFADPANPPASTMGPVTVDISKFVSDNGRRDNMIQNNYLESNKYPLAKFVPAKFESLPAAYKDGADYAFKVTGDLTVKNVTKPVTFDVTAKLTGTTLTGQATTEILMSTFGVGPISILGILNTEDKVKITFTFVAKPQ